MDTLREILDTAGIDPRMYATEDDLVALRRLVAIVAGRSLVVEDILGEEWRPITGFEWLYEVSSLGRVRGLLGKSNGRSGVKKQRIYGGYPTVNLSKNGKGYLSSVHKLVAEAFVGPRPDGYYCCHGDGNPENNAAINLRWDTPKANSEDRDRQGRLPRGSGRKTAKLNEEKAREIRDRIKRGDYISLDKLAEEYGVSRGSIVQVRDRRTWGHA